jgi:hypothetical protein
VTAHRSFGLGRRRGVAGRHARGPRCGRCRCAGAHFLAAWSPGDARARERSRGNRHVCRCTAVLYPGFTVSRGKVVEIDVLADPVRLAPARPCAPWRLKVLVPDSASDVIAKLINAFALGTSRSEVLPQRLRHPPRHLQNHSGLDLDRTRRRGEPKASGLGFPVFYVAPVPGMVASQD